jgi:Asp-tRNA(Asn)/Glu-tRNA(Gln) amidotransferase A subunit family amidase
VSDLALQSCEQLIALYRARKCSPVEVLAAVAKRIDALNPALNAFSYLDLEQAQAAARES